MATKFYLVFKIPESAIITFTVYNEFKKIERMHKKENKEEDISAGIMKNSLKMYAAAICYAPYLLLACCTTCTFFPFFLSISIEAQL